MRYTRAVRSGLPLIALSQASSSHALARLPDGLDKALSDALVARMLSLGGVYDREHKGYTFTGTVKALRQRVEHVILTGVPEAVDLAGFATPAAAIAAMIAEADIRAGQHVLVPCAGTGALLTACLNRGANCIAVEPCGARHTVAENCRGYGVLLSCIAAEFESMHPYDLDGYSIGGFDAAVLSPPLLLPYNAYAPLAMTVRAARFVRPGGRLVALLPQCVVSRTDAEYALFRETLLGVADEKGLHYEVVPGLKVGHADIALVVLSMTVGSAGARDVSLPEAAG